MKNRVVTISREFGSGGRTIGRALAVRLGIPCYDEEVIEKLSERRRAYYQLHTDTRWGEADNYHVALDSGVLGIEKCVDILADLYRSGEET